MVQFMIPSAHMQTQTECTSCTRTHCANRHAHIQAYTSCKHACSHARTHIHMHIHMQVVLKHTHTHTHTHTHAACYSVIKHIQSMHTKFKSYRQYTCSCPETKQSKNLRRWSRDPESNLPPSPSTARHVMGFW
jgi:hypothetical protein